MLWIDVHYVESNMRINLQFA